MIDAETTLDTVVATVIALRLVAQSHVPREVFSRSSPVATPKSWVGNARHASAPAAIISAFLRWPAFLQVRSPWAVSRVLASRRRMRLGRHPEARRDVHAEDVGPWAAPCTRTASFACDPSSMIALSSGCVRSRGHRLSRPLVAGQTVVRVQLVRELELDAAVDVGAEGNSRPAEGSIRSSTHRRRDRWRSPTTSPRRRRCLTASGTRRARPRRTVTGTKVATSRRSRP
jgi:hypothetical protein